MAKTKKNQPILARGEVLLKLPSNRDDVVLRFGMKQVKQIENDFDGSFFDAFRETMNENARMSHITDMFIIATQGSLPGLTEEGADEIITEAGIPESYDALSQAYLLATHTPDALREKIELEKKAALQAQEDALKAIGSTTKPEPKENEDP